MNNLSRRVGRLEGNTGQEPWIRRVRKEIMALGIIPPAVLPESWSVGEEELTLVDVLKSIDGRKG